MLRDGDTSRSCHVFEKSWLFLCQLGQNPALLFFFVVLQELLHCATRNFSILHQDRAWFAEQDGQLM